MKVILKGIKPYDPELDGEMEDDLNYYRSLLEQIPFPLELEAKEVYPHVINLKEYIKDPESPYSPEEWGLIWFDYEEVKEIQD